MGFRLFRVGVGHSKTGTLLEPEGGFEEVFAAFYRVLGLGPRRTLPCFGFRV